jgi:flagellar basal-body rod protein FlgB
MLSRIDDEIGFMQKALGLHAQRQNLLAGNIANADTPNYKAVDIDFVKALRSAVSGQTSGLATTASGHMQPMGTDSTGARTQYRSALQPSVDNNTVDMDVERSQFIDNAVRYQFALDRVSNKFKTIEIALRGQ